MGSFGVMVAAKPSNKPDRKEPIMDREGNGKVCAAGRFVKVAPRGRPGRWLLVTVLLAWDGLLLYMIVHCLIVPVYGAAFVAIVSFYLGYQI